MPRPPLSRRTVVSTGLSAGLGAGAVGLTGCSSDVDASAPATPGRVARTSADPDADVDPDVDQGLVDDLRTRISQVQALVRATRSAQPGLAARLRPLADLHASHGEALGGLVGLDGLPAVPGRQRAALSALRSAETDLRQGLVRGAVSARSGALALLLASMAAGLAQYLATIDEASA